MKKAIIYFSLTGNVERLAKETFDGDFYALKPMIRLPKNKILKYVVWIYYAILKKRVPYEITDFALDKYEELVLVTSVNAGRVSPIMKSFLDDHEIKNKSLTFMIVHIGEPGVALQTLKERLGKENTVINELSINIEDKNNEKINK